MMIDNSARIFIRDYDVYDKKKMVVDFFSHSQYIYRLIMVARASRVRFDIFPHTSPAEILFYHCPDLLVYIFTVQ